MRLPRKGRQNASQSPPVAPGATQRARVVERLMAAESKSIKVSDDELDELSEVTPEDISRAIDVWDEAQKDQETGLDGLLEAKRELES